MVNHLIKKGKKVVVVHILHQPQRQSLDAPPKVIAIEKRVYPHQEAPKHKSQ